jgi:hypothetical protein
MMDKVSVFRDESGLKAALDTIKGLKERYRNACVTDQGKCFNTELMEALELGYLLDLAEVTTVSALARQESRGAHYREDFPQRDDATWLRHTLAFKTEAGIVLQHKPVTITRFDPAKDKAPRRQEYKVDIEPSCLISSMTSVRRPASATRPPKRSSGSATRRGAFSAPAAPRPARARSTSWRPSRR